MSLKIKISLNEILDKNEFKGWNSRPYSQYDLDHRKTFYSHKHEGMLQWQEMPEELKNKLEKPQYKNNEGCYISVADLEINPILKQKSEKELKKFGITDPLELEHQLLQYNHYYKKFSDIHLALEEAKRHIAPGRIVEVSMGTDIIIRNEDKTKFLRVSVRWFSYDGDDLKQYIHYAGNDPNRWIPMSWFTKKTRDSLGENKNLNEYQNLSLLTESKALEYADTVLNSKQTRKLIYQYMSERRGKPPSEKDMNLIHNLFKKDIKKLIPDDIEDKEKAIAIIWVKNQWLKDVLEFGRFIEDKQSSESFNYFLEKYFQLKNFITQPNKKDLNNISSLTELKSIVRDAQELYKRDQEKKSYLSAPEGTELLFENNEWKIYIAHNKGAACQLGKNTSWCTAAPGLDYFQKYYKPNDPLFVFINKKDPEQKYQFHYGTKQFMDKDDKSIKNLNKKENEYMSKELFIYLHSLLSQVAGEKYPIINENYETNSETGELIEKSEGITSNGDMNIYYLDVETGQYAQRDNNRANIINYSTPFHNGTINYSFNYRGEMEKGLPYEINVVGKIPSNYTKAYDKITLQDIKNIPPESITLLSIKWFDNKTQYVGSYDKGIAQSDSYKWYFHPSVHKEQREIFDKYFKEFFETNIRGQEDRFAQEIFENNMSVFRKKK